MFITTPFVWFITNRLYQQGKLDKHQRDSLILQDRQINLIVTAGAILVVFAYWF